MCQTRVCPDKIRQERWTDPDTGRIVRHPHEASPHSGAGNCWCGRWDTHQLHEVRLVPYRL